MSKILPPKVEAAKGEPHQVFDWAVPARVDGTPLTIAGSVEYQPPSNSIPKPLVAVLIFVTIGGAVAVWLRRRHS